MDEEEAETLPSAKVKVCEPEVLRFTLKDPTPLTRLAAPDKTAFESVVDGVTTPLYWDAVFPAESLAVTVTVKGVSTVAAEGTPLKTNWVAWVELTVMVSELEFRMPSEAESVLDPAVLS
jgi:hypothetical protein